MEAIHNSLFYIDMCLINSDYFEQKVQEIGSHPKISTEAKDNLTKIFTNYDKHCRVIHKFKDDKPQEFNNYINALRPQLVEKIALEEVTKGGLVNNASLVKLVQINL